MVAFSRSSLVRFKAGLIAISWGTRNGPIAASRCEVSSPRAALIGSRVDVDAPLLPAQCQNRVLIGLAGAKVERLSARIERLKAPERPDLSVPMIEIPVPESSVGADCRTRWILGLPSTDFGTPIGEPPRPSAHHRPSCSAKNRRASSLASSAAAALYSR
jgi:hypothetical protein